MSLAEMLPSTVIIAHNEQYDIQSNLADRLTRFQREAYNTVFRHSKSLTQVAAFPYVIHGTSVEVLLVTSRRRGRWLLPRGWPIEGMSYGMAASKEASEEAGVVGEMGHKALGDYHDDKRTGNGYRVPCRVFVYPLLVTQQQLDWPEKDQREQIWCNLSDAIAMVRQDSLAKFLSSLRNVPDLRTHLAAYH